ncbi:MAG TPA: DUF192 domain-containing protein [Terriglobales bacterium]|nr:DUF192 domain-containing protein [Terriglobales bacterium]
MAFRVAVADSIVGRLVGLLGRRSLPQDSGVWIVPCNAVHTIGMLFSFDLVLIDKNFKVVGLRELVRPFTVTWPNHSAESVLELPAHSIFRSRTQIGDQLLIERYEAKKPPKSGAPEVAGPPATERSAINVALAGSRSALSISPPSSQPDVARSSFVDS